MAGKVYLHTAYSPVEDLMEQIQEFKIWFSSSGRRSLLSYLSQPVPLGGMTPCQGVDLSPFWKHFRQWDFIPSLYCQ